jgi:hypothetical protein
MAEAQQEAAPVSGPAEEAVNYLGSPALLFSAAFCVRSWMSYGRTVGDFPGVMLSLVFYPEPAQDGLVLVNRIYFLLELSVV